MNKRRLLIFNAENFHFGQVPRQIGKTLLTLLIYLLLTFTLAVLVYLAFNQQMLYSLPNGGLFH